jgi:uncharacterized membrane protein YqiK
MSIIRYHTLRDFSMKTICKAVLISALMASVAGCGRAAPDAGQAAVLTQKPWIFGHGGVDPTPITTGLSFVALSTQVTYVDMTPTAFDVAYADIMSKDGIPLDFHSTVTLRVTDPVALVTKFSGGMDAPANNYPVWYTQNLQPILNNYIRDSFKGYDMHSLAIETSGTNAVEREVRARLESYIKMRGLPVDLINFTLGRINPPQGIKTQRIRTAEEQQRQQTELQTKIAEENREQAERARAEADNAYRQSMSLSPEQFVELQRIKMMHDVCDNKGCTFIVGNAQPIVSSK